MRTDKLRVTSTKKSGAKKKDSNETKSRMIQILGSAARTLSLPFISTKHRIAMLRERRPHRSFRLTRRRDYVRSLKLPGYWAFSFSVLSRLRKQKYVYLGVILLYAALIIVFGSMTSQDIYREMGALITEGTGEAFAGSWGQLTQAGILAAAVFTGGTAQLSDTQQIAIVLISLLTWLTTVWLLREQVAGRSPRIRDGLYNSAAPLISTVLVGLYLVIQLLPIGLLAIVFGGLSGVGLLEPGFGMYLFSAVAVLVVALVMYWVTSTFIALVVVTLPGMYPFQALRAAGDLVVGRRLRIMYRLLWMLLGALVLWLAVMVPVVLFDNWLKDATDWGWLDVVPTVPLIATIVSSTTAVWAASYVYLLYRRVVEDDASPA